LQKLEKIIKKEHNEFENVAGAGATNVKLVHSKMVKTLKMMKKMTEENNRIVKTREDLQAQIDESKSNI
jgi:chromosome segregation ATPase